MMWRKKKDIPCASCEEFRGELLLLDEKLDEAEDELSRAREAMKSPVELISKLLSGDPLWYDYAELSPADLKAYHDSAQQILASPVFQNEVNFLKSNWGKQALLAEEDVTKIAENIQKMRWCLMGIEMLRERLESIPDNTIQTTKDDLDKAV